MWARASHSCWHVRHCSTDVAPQLPDCVDRGIGAKSGLLRSLFTWSPSKDARVTAEGERAPSAGPDAALAVPLPSVPACQTPAAPHSCFSPPAQPACPAAGTTLGASMASRESTAATAAPRATVAEVAAAPGQAAAAAGKRNWFGWRRKSPEKAPSDARDATAAPLYINTGPAPAEQRAAMAQTAQPPLVQTQQLHQPPLAPSAPPHLQPRPPAFKVTFSAPPQGATMQSSQPPQPSQPQQPLQAPPTLSAMSPTGNQIRDAPVGPPPTALTAPPPPFPRYVTHDPESLPQAGLPIQYVFSLPPPPDSGLPASGTLL